MAVFVIGKSGRRRRGRITVAKQAPTDPEWRTIHGAADSMRREMNRAFLRSIARTQDALTLAAIERALESGDLAAAEEAIPWDVLEREFTAEIQPVVAETVRRGGEASIKHLPAAVVAQMRFDLLNPRSVDFIRQHTAELVREVIEETRAAIRGVIQRAFEEGMHPRRSARYIRELVGLTERQAAAVENLRRRLLRDGASMQRAEEEAAKYSRRLHRNRALNIARTETLRAANEGQNLLWQQGIEEGLILPERTFREWIVTPDDRLCEFCEPMDGQRVGMNEPFQSELGPVDLPPLHPGCRCTVALHFED